MQAKTITNLIIDISKSFNAQGANLGYSATKRNKTWYLFCIHMVAMHYNNNFVITGPLVSQHIQCIHTYTLKEISQLQKQQAFSCFW